MDQMPDMGLEPQARARSNTWPLPRPENFIEPDAVDMPEAKCGVNLPGGSHVKKNSSRRNAWGNLSYADLITQAIGSAPEKRLTLSQIYEWMVQNVTYFKDKGDSNSSAGWKNSIRHNLSLHNRFMRVQNEGTGKSSWWMINPDAKPGKSARRRATSMETSKFEKRRGRVKRKVEALRSGLDPPTPSPSSSVSESLDLFPESPLHGGFQLSPDFRPRASSNASTTSCSGGRLSPIPAVSEGADWPPGPPPGYYGPEQLAGSLEQNMRLGQGAAGGGASPFGGPPPPPYRPSPSSVPPSYLPPSCSLHRQVHPCPNCALPHKQRSLGYGEGVESAATMMGQLMGALNPTMLDDLNLNIETVPLHDFDCNVDEVIKHELSLDGTLDFNFSGQQQPSSAPGSGHGGFSGDSWVH